MLKTKIKRGVLLATAAWGLWAGPISPASAAEPNFQGDNALAQFLLPYSPILFDLVLQGGRSFAVITYGERHYDPVTRSFVLNDLRIQRGPVDFSVKRLRSSQRTTLMQGISLNTAGLDLPPPLREGLRELGRETVSGDIVVDVRSDEARRAYDLHMEVELPEIGQLSLSATVDGFHILVPVTPPDASSAPDQPIPPATTPEVFGSLLRASVTYQDEGLMEIATAIAAGQQGVTSEQLTAGLALLPEISVGQWLGELEGGASPALQAQALQWARTAGAFLKERGAVSVSFYPAEPVPLSRFQAGVLDEPLISALNPTVFSDRTNAAPGRQPAIDPATDPYGAALAMLSGQGMLQDREAGALALLTLFETGDLRTIQALASNFGSTMSPNLAPGALADLYASLLVGKALGNTVSDATLTELGAKLTPISLRASELEAGRYFRTRTDQGRALVPLSADNVGQFRPEQLRALAYDAYDGAGAPRDMTEAYALALVAAAAGDPLATSLRDDLAEGALENRIVVAMGEARARAAELWAGYQSAGPAPQPN